MNNSAVTRINRSNDYALQFSQCRPLNASTLEVEGQIVAGGVKAEIWHYRWDKPVQDELFVPPLCILNLALIRRPRAMQAQAVVRIGARSSRRTAIGDCMFLPAGSEVRAHIPDVDHRMLSCIFTPDSFEQYLEIDWKASEIAACFNIQNPRIRSGLMSLAEEAHTPGFASELLVQSTACSLMIEVARHFRGTLAAHMAPANRLTPRQLSLIEDLAENLLIQTPSLAEMARLCGVSSRQLTRAFKNSTGKTLSEFFADARIRQAKRLLSNPDLMIKNVAFDTGFKTAAAFTTAFRKATGWSPKQFRREMLGLTE